MTGRAGITQKGGDCGYPFLSGKSYLVFSQPRVAGMGQDVSECTRTAPIAKAIEDIRFLNTRAPN